MANAIEIVINAINNAGKALGDVKKDLSGVEDAATGAGEKMKSVGKGAAVAGAGMTAGLTIPLAAAGTAAINAANDINAGLANVASLGVANVEQYRDSVQQLSVDVGKSTTDLTDGLYQVVSAFGETEDSIEVLRIAAESGSAGLATTEEAINLLSAVTKGYGDTSAEAVQKAADLAFTTVQLGQTTFPELAASMGKVVPLAATLGVTQEELAAQFATLTGVTGNASEVGTQLRATYQALLKPTAEMGSAINSVANSLAEQGKLVDNEFTAAWAEARQKMFDAQAESIRLQTAMDELAATGQTGSDAYADYAEALELNDEKISDMKEGLEELSLGLGQSIVESVGYNEALQMIAGTADGNTNTLGKMFGSVEALNAVLALSGAQADTYAEKYAAMTDVNGAASDAFAAQTEGVNSTAFQMQQLQQQVTVLAQDLGSALIPALTQALTAITPLIQKVAEWVSSFQNLSPQMQQTIIVVTAVVAAIGPLLTTVGLIVSAFGALAPAVGAVVSILGALLSPVGLIVAAVGGLLAILFDWGGANEKVAQTLQQWGLSGAADFVRGLHEGMSGLVESVKDLLSGNMTFAEFFDAAIPEWISTLFAWTWPILAPIGWMVKLMEWAWPNFDKPDWIENLLNFRWPKFPSRPAWLGGDGGNATGTSYFPGGATWVGETGPELVSLPRGSQIFPAGESRRMAAAGVVGGGVNITINANVTNESDITRLARRVADELQRRGR